MLRADTIAVVVRRHIRAFLSISGNPRTALLYVAQLWFTRPLERGCVVRTHKTYTLRNEP